VGSICFRADVLAGNLIAHNFLQNMKRVVTVNESPIIGYTFSDFKFDVVRGCLMRHGKELPLRNQSLQLLLYFIEHPDSLISKDELAAVLWNETSVTDNALVQCVTEIRRVLNDNPHNPRFIKTILRAGYRFVADVHVIRDAHSLPIPRSPSLPAGDARQERAEVATINAPTRSESPVRIPVWRRKAMLLVPCVLVAGALLLLYYGARRHALEQSSSASAASGLPMLAVFPLANATGRQDLDWLREGLSDMILTDLAHTGKWNVLSREKMHSLVDASDRSGALSQSKSLAIARSVHATDFIVGSVSASGQQITIDIEIRDGKDGHVVGTDSASMTDPLQIVATASLLSTDIAYRLGLRTDAQPSLADVMTSNVDAYRYYSLGVEKAEQFQNAQAIELFKKAIKFDPKFAMAYARIGYAYAVQDFQPEMGRPYLEKALDISAPLPALNRLYIDAWFAISRSDYDAAIGILHQIIQQYPEETEADCELARLLRGQERLEEANALLRHAIQANPGAEELYNVLGLMLISMERYPEAIAYDKQYVALAPQNPNTHDSLGMAYQMAGLYDAALAEYIEALQLDPEFEPSIVNLGDTYYQMGRYHDALREYNRYIEVAQSSNAKALGYGNIATVYAAMNRIADEQTAANNELRFNRTSVWSSLQLALAKHQKGRIAALGKSLFENPPNPERGAARNLRMELYYRGTIELNNGDAQGALAHFRSAMQHMPTASGIDSYEDCLANAYLELGMIPEAIGEYQRILKLNPNYPLAYFHLGQAFQKQHRWPEAVTAFRHFLKANPTADQDSPQVIEAKRCIANGGQ
jgi:tetratricopeptide (TPR) repeat protein/DNA-binding winged helix-turn-helix (wHTH) protein